MAPNYSIYSNSTSQDYIKLLMQGFAGECGSPELQKWFSNGMSAWTYADMWIDGSGAEKNAAQRGILTMLVDGFKNFLSSQAQKAEEEVDESSNNIKNAEKDGDQVATDTENQLEVILTGIDTDIASIQDALNIIEDIGGTQLGAIKSKLETKKKEIETQVEIIEEAQENNNIEAIKEALGVIQGLQSEVSGYLEIFDSLINSIKLEQANVETAAGSIETSQTQAETAIANGLKEIKGVAVEKISQEGTKNVTYIVKGGAEKGEAITLGTIGVATSSAASQRAEDLLQASQTHIQGGGENLTALGSAMTEFGGEMATISTYSTTVGKQLTSASNLIGKFDNTANRYINSIGSISQNVEATSTALGTAVTSDLEIIKEYPNTDANTYGNEYMANQVKATPVELKHVDILERLTSSTSQSQTPNGDLTLQTPTVDLSKLS